MQNNIVLVNKLDSYYIKITVSFSEVPVVSGFPEECAFLPYFTHPVRSVQLMLPRIAGLYHETSDTGTKPKGWNILCAACHSSVSSGGVRQGRPPTTHGGITMKHQKPARSPKVGTPFAQPAILVFHQAG